MPLPLPPGVSRRSFSAALRQFESIVGADWVFTSEDDVNLYRDSYSPFWNEGEEPIPSAAVAPDSVEQVQAIVKIAGQHRIPLWTISTGKNLGYGGSAPLLSGSLVLDLKRMNRILEVNEKNAYALVEPGVSYFDFYRYTQERNMRLWMDCPDPGWGSLIGNALDRGGGHSPMRDHFAAACGMEVVLANGDVVRTGMGALPGSKVWQQYKYGYGPYLDGMFSQSNFGIVTKMGFWLYPEPEAYLSGIVQVKRQRDITPLVDGMSYLYNSGTIQGTAAITSPVTSTMSDPELVAVRNKAGGAAPEELERYIASKDIAYWSTTLQFYGPAKVIAAQWEHAKEKFSAIPQVRFQDGLSLRFPLPPRADREVAEQGALRHSEPGYLHEHRRAELRPHVLFTDYSDDGRGGDRGATRLRRGAAGSRPGGRSQPGARQLLPAVAARLNRLPHRARRGKEPEEPRSVPAFDSGGRGTWLG